jgi:hypothetical protein
LRSEERSVEHQRVDGRAEDGSQTGHVGSSEEMPDGSNARRPFERTARPWSLKSAGEGLANLVPRLTANDGRARRGCSVPMIRRAQRADESRRGQLGRRRAKAELGRRAVTQGRRCRAASSSVEPWRAVSSGMEARNSCLRRRDGGESAGLAGARGEAAGWPCAKALTAAVRATQRAGVARLNTG